MCDYSNKFYWNFLSCVLFVSRCLQSKTRLPAKLNFALQQRWRWELQAQIYKKKRLILSLQYGYGKLAAGGLTCRKFQNVGSRSFGIYNLNSILFTAVHFCKCNVNQMQFQAETTQLCEVTSRSRRQLQWWVDAKTVNPRAF